MKRLSIIAAAAIGLLFPLGLAFAVYLASASSLEEPADAAFSTSQTIAQPTVRVERAKTQPRPAATTTERDETRRRCDEPEHRSDPDCTGSAGTSAAEPGDDGSGRGRGGGGSDGSGSSGSGSGSGSDSGSGDSSGKGSGGDDD